MANKEFKEISQKEYRNLFGVKADRKEEKCKNEEALRYALDIRKFEIDLYWKRATYFWTFIGAAMAGFFVIQTIGEPEKTYLSVVVGCLGFMFSFAWFFVNKGSKYWQENWENHVDLLEDSVVGPLYKVVISRPAKDKKNHLRNLIGPAAYSVSKINQIVSLFVTLLWFILILKALSPFDRSAYIEWWYVVLIAITFIACIVIWKLGKTDKENYDNLNATLRETKLKDS